MKKIKQERRHSKIKYKKIKSLKENGKKLNEQEN